MVVAGGSPPFGRRPGGRSRATAPRVIAADGGVDRALALGLHVDVAIGDFDSRLRGGLAAAEAGGRADRAASGCQGRDRPRARARRGDRARPGTGSSSSARTAAGSTTCSARCCSCSATSAMRASRSTPSSARARPRRPRLAHARGRAAATSSRCCPCTARPRASRPRVSSTRCAGETLPAGSSRGVSNVFAAAEARVTVERGCLLAIRPGADERRTR